MENPFKKFFKAPRQEQIDKAIDDYGAEQQEIMKKSREEKSQNEENSSDSPGN